MRRILLALLVSAGISTGVAHARSEKTLAYQREPAWAASVRFLRVDAKLKVVEKDPEAGYVLFEFVEDKRTFHGSLEVIEVEKDGRKAIRFILQIEDRPSWVEIEMLTKLERKLRAELGSPARAPARVKDKDRSEPPKKDGAKAEPPNDDGPPVSDTP